MQGRYAKFSVHCKNALRCIFTAAAIGSLAVTPILSFNHNGDLAFAADVQNELVLLNKAGESVATAMPSPADQQKDNHKQSRYLDGIYRFEEQRRRQMAGGNLITRPLGPNDEIQLQLTALNSPGPDF